MPETVDGTPVTAVWADTFAKLLAYFDRDGNGTLSEKEAARLPDPRAVRQAMDRNGDGDVSRREFTGAADLFDKLDGDEDGLLSAEEAEKTATPKK